MKIPAALLVPILVWQSIVCADDRAPRIPVLVELFTSEGCSSCPPADELLAKLVAEQPVEKAQIIALAFHVDYWNKLGWPDRFSSPKFTQRQYDYATFFGGNRVYTPQMIVDGKAEFVGSDSKKAQAALHAAAAQPKPAVTISVEKQEAAEIQLRLNLPESMRLSKDQQADWIVAVTEDDLTSQVQRGENAGRKLRHVAVVRMLKSAGVLSKADDMKVGYAIVPLQKEWDRSKLKIVAFVQDRAEHHILAAGAIDLRSAPQ